jgi:hypothetical protein
MRTPHRSFGAGLFGLASVLSLLLSAIFPAAATTAPAPTPGVATLVNECYDTVGQKLNTAERAACRTLQAFADSLAALCRTPLRDLPSPTLVDDCSLVDGRVISEQQINRFRRSAVFRSLVLQRRLAWRAPLYEQQIAGTHNSFNASSYDVPRSGRPIRYFPTLTNQDPNQVYSITDQLRMGIRGIEIDLHWVPSIYGNLATGGYWVDVCHGQSARIPPTPLTIHLGCVIDRSLQNTLAEIRAWLDRHHHQFLLIYLENQLDGKRLAHDIAARLIRRGLGRLVYRPPSRLAPGHCDHMPYANSEAQMSRAGARVLLVGDCGPGTWNHWVFTRGPKWNEGGDPTTYGHADCAADRAARETHSVFRRWFEASTLLEALTDATETLTPTATRRMVRCGVNLTGWDQLTPQDGRLRAFIWSWAPRGRQRPGRCAYQGVDGRFRAGRCDQLRHYACVDPRLDWHVTDARGPARRGPQECAAEFPGSRYGVPPNGYRNWQLRRARPNRRDTTWLDYTRRHHQWRIG